MDQEEVQDNILVLNVFYELIVEGNAEVRISFIRLLHGATIEHFFSCSCRYQTSRKGGDDITWILNEAIPVKPDVMNHVGVTILHALSKLHRHETVNHYRMHTQQKSESSMHEVSL